MLSVGKTHRGGGARVIVIASLGLLESLHPSIAQEVAKTRLIPYISAENSDPAHGDLAHNFTERWLGNNGLGAEFTIGSDGVAKENEPREAVNDNTDNTHHFDADTDEAQIQITAVNAPRDLDISHQFDSKNGLVSTDSADQEVSAAKCGPSPLDPEAVRSLVATTAKAQGVDETFAVAIAWAESDFDRSRNSPKGARGPMQLMPATARRFGVTDVCDPAQNIAGGIRYLRALLDQFKNPLLVAAAYNSGEQRIYEYGGVPPFAETVGYVAKVVNFQMGLPMPARGRKAPSSGSNVPAPLISSTTGVIAVRKTAEFVGGVMHF
jgi:hypothetical protein